MATILNHFFISSSSQSLRKPFLSPFSLSKSPHTDHHLSFSASPTQYLHTQQLSLFKTHHNLPPLDEYPFARCIELLRLSVNCNEVDLARAVHASILKLPEDTYLGNALLSAYLKLGLLRDAYEVFNGILTPDVVSFTAMISGFAKSGYEFDAIELFFKMRESGIDPNEFTFVAILSASSRLLELGLGFQLHCLIVKTDFVNNVYVMNALMGLYSKCGGIDNVSKVFDEMPERDIASWNTVIGNAVSGFMYEKAFQLFSEMQRIDGFRVDHFTISSLLDACSGCWAAIRGLEIHAHALKVGFESNLSVNNALITFYSKCGGVKDIDVLFRRMPVKDVITWTSMITAYMELGMVDSAINLFKVMPERNPVSYNAFLQGLCQNGEGSNALNFFLKMVENGMEITESTLTSAISACSLLTEKKASEQMHSFVLKFGFGSNACVEAALLYMCTRCRRMEDAQRMFFQRKSSHFSMDWTSMICGYARDGQPEEAISLFHQGRLEEAITVDAVTSTGVLGICGTLGFLEMGEQIHCYALKSGFLHDVCVGNALVSMYSGCGDMENAIKAFDTMPVRDRVSWNGLITGHLLQRQGDEALAVWLRMEAAAIKPDAVTFVLVISSYKHTESNLVDDCQRLFFSMQSEYNIVPTLDHYASFVSVLGHWGLLEEAERMIFKMPFNPEAGVWRALLHGCRIHLNMTIGKRTAKRILAMIPENPSTSILISNLYSASGRWHCAETIREEMRKKGLRKLPTRSWIIHQNSIHSFFARDKSHIHSKDIYTGLEILMIECLKAGYEPDTSFVLHEVEENQKKDFLIGHSAKLAVTYGILMTKPGRPIRVTKNVILCGDCHNFLKYASLVTKREFFLRDTSGIHCFLDGQCSCNDRW